MNTGDGQEGGLERVVRLGEGEVPRAGLEGAGGGSGMRRRAATRAWKGTREETPSSFLI